MSNLPASDDGFHEHLDKCAQCEKQPFNLCSEGARLLSELHREPGFAQCPECGNLAMNPDPTCPMCGTSADPSIEDLVR
jgi:hypothetical protein